MSTSDPKAAESAAKADDKKSIDWAKWIMPVVTAVLGFALGQAATTWRGRLQSLEYGVNTVSRLFNAPEMGDQKLAVSINGKEVENLSSGTVYLFNRASGDYGNVDITLRFSSTDGKPVAITRSSATIATDPTIDLPLQATSTASDGPNETISYTLKSAPRLQNSPVFKGNFVFATASAPEITMVVTSPGLTMTKVPLVNKENKKDDWTWVTLVFGMIVFILSVLGVTSIAELVKRPKIKEVIHEMAATHNAEIQEAKKKTAEFVAYKEAEQLVYPDPDHVITKEERLTMYLLLRGKRSSIKDGLAEVTRHHGENSATTAKFANALAIVERDMAAHEVWMKRTGQEIPPES